MTINEVNFSILQNVVQDCPNFAGIKYSKVSLIGFQNLLALKDKISLLMGRDKLDYPAFFWELRELFLGQPASSRSPMFVSTGNSQRGGDYEGARRQQMIVNGFFEKLEETLNLQEGEQFSFFKNTLRLRGINVGGVKEPLPTLDSSKEDLIVHLVKEFLEVST